MKIKKIFISCFVLLSLLLSNQALAVASVSFSEKGPLLASVGAVDYRIVSQDKNKLVFSFNLSNGEGVQTGIKYGVKLVKDTKTEQFVVDEKVYDESVTLLPNALVSKEITYVAPASLDGEYSAYLTTRNAEGLIFGVSYVGKIKLEKSVKGIEILSETCKLSIPGEKMKYNRYNLVEGVDISSKETLQLNCSVSNTSDKKITATPFFETHFRTIYGEIVPQSEVKNEALSFEPGEKKDIALLLPKANKPQAYDLKVSLQYDGTTSNTVISHYVIQGVSASIQNLSLDKDFYKKGETAKFFFSWSQSADNFQGSRLGKASVMPEVYLDAQITNRFGLKCNVPVKQLLPTEHNTLRNDLNIDINRNCVNPKISVSLVDKDGNVLDQKNFDIKTTAKEGTNNYVILIITIVASILAVVLIIVYLKKRKNKNPENQNNIPVAIFIFLFVGASVWVNYPLLKIDAQIQALMAINGGGGGGSGGTVTTTSSTGTTPTGLGSTITFDKSIYEPGATVGITDSMYYTGCTNVTRDIEATGHLEGITVSYMGQDTKLFDTTVHGQVALSKDSSLPAPAVAGEYKLKMHVTGYYPVIYSAYDFITTTDEFGSTSSDVEVIRETDFNVFKASVMYYISDIYSSSSVVNDSIINATSAEQVNNIISSNSYNIMSAIKSGGDVAFTRDYEIPKISVKGVKTTINGQVGNITVNAGENIPVEWDSKYAASCTCTCVNPTNDSPISCGSTGSTSCGTGIGNPKYSTPYPIPNVTQKTKFKVICI